MSGRDEAMDTVMAYFRREKDKKLFLFRQQNRYIRPGQLLFTGSSLMEQFHVTEYCATAGVPLVAYNRGIGGYTTDEFLAGVDAMLLDVKPSKVFINIGTNDIRPMEDGGDWLERLVKNYRTILEIAREKLPETETVMLAYYPVNRSHPMMRENPGFSIRTNENVGRANAAVKALAEEFGHLFLDVSAGIRDEAGNLKLERTVDGVHMDAEAYRAVFEALRPYL